MTNLAIRPRLLSASLSAMMIWVGLSVAFDCQGAEPGESETAAKELQLKTPTIPNHLEGAVRDLNAQFSEGIDPDKNAVVYLVRLLGDDIFDAGLRDDSLAMLGIESIGNGSPRFAYFEQYVTSVVPKDASKRQDLLKQLTLEFQSANGAVWKSADYPALAQYFAANEAALDELVRISKFPSYYAPILTAENPPTLLGASYAIERRIPYLGQCLSIRASQRMGDGNFAGAVSDLIAVHQLANQLAEGSPLDVSLAKAHWVDSYAFQAEYAILASGMLTADQAKEYQKELQNVSSMAPSQTAADIGERLILRQEIESLKEHDAAFYAFFDWAPASHAEQMKALRAANIDWDLALQRANEVQDETVETLLISDAKRQAEEIDRLNSEVDEWRKRNDADETTLLEALEVDRDQGSRWIGEAVALALRTNIWQRLCTDRRGHVRRDFISVGLALEEYHRRRGYYPAALADLSPEILPSIPNDSHSQKPFTYMRNDDQHVELISWGTNRENDAGRLLQDDLILKLGR